MYCSFRDIFTTNKSENPCRGIVKKADRQQATSESHAPFRMEPSTAQLPVKFKDKLQAAGKLVVTSTQLFVQRFSSSNSEETNTTDAPRKRSTSIEQGMRRGRCCCTDEKLQDTPPNPQSLLFARRMWSHSSPTHHGTPPSPTPTPPHSNSPTRSSLHLPMSCPPAFALPHGGLPMQPNEMARR